MSILFSRSTRSLDNDSGSAGLIVVGSTVIIVAAWLLWFFFAQVPVYETSREVSLRRDGQLIVQFSPDSLARIRPGQEASFSPLVSNDTLGESLPAIVMETPSSTGRREDTVQVYVKTPTLPSTEGEVKIIVDHVSPFALLMQPAHE